MDAIQKIEAADIRKLVENLILADRVMQRQGLVWCDQYEELSKPIRAARKALDDALAANAQTLASKDALIQSQADEIGRMRKRLIAYADSMYFNSLEIFRRPECLGWEQKVKSNQYTEVEHEAHRRANEAMGAHRGIYAALNLFDAESATTQPKETS